MDAEAAANRGYTGILKWMRAAEKIWKETAESRMTLIERFNYHNELGAQFPISGLRVVYAKAGTLPAATIIRDARAVIDHMLYWFAPATEAEAYYLTAILNSETTRSRIQKLQAVGQFGARHFDKVMFTLPIPRFDLQDQLHETLAALAQKAEAVAAEAPIEKNVKFQRARKLVRVALTETGIAQEIDRAVGELLVVTP